MKQATQKRLPISVCMVSGAEAARIGRALESVAGFASEIIVVLNAEVADGTDRIAAEHGAKVFREPWKGFIAQKNSAADKATQDWLLNLDADEIVPPALAEEIAAVVSAPGARHAAYEFPRCSFYCGRWIRHGDWYPDRVLRLWKRGAARWTGQDPHARLEVKGTVGRLRSDLLHHSNESIARQIAKIAPYHAEFVKQRVSGGGSAGFFQLVLRPWWRLVRAYGLRLGFLDGWQGFYIAALSSFSTLTRYALVREAEAQNRNQTPVLECIPESVSSSTALSSRNTWPACWPLSRGKPPRPRKFCWPMMVPARPCGRSSPSGRRRKPCRAEHVWQPHEGFRRARILNQAIARARSEYLVFLDGDTLPHPQFIADHRRLGRRGAFIQGHRALVKERAAAWFGLEGSHRTVAAPFGKGSSGA